VGLGIGGRGEMFYIERDIPLGTEVTHEILIAMRFFASKFEVTMEGMEWQTEMP